MTASKFNLFCLLATLLVVVESKSTKAQIQDFKFGDISKHELEMTRYELDTTASAVVLYELGQAVFDLENLNKIYFQYYAKIKILKQEGKKYANFKIPLRKMGMRQEGIKFIKASAFNLIENTRRESSLGTSDIYIENEDEYYSNARFVVPNVQIGSILEITYQLETPFTFNFIPWEFQSDIPKIKSEFWGKYPAYYQYNATLKGYLKLTTNSVDIEKNCVGGKSNYGLSRSADCTQLKFGMEKIPAFKEEEYMTARKNFLSELTFELTKLTQITGTTDQITTTWRDIEQELLQHEFFGAQLKRVKSLLKDKIIEFTAENTNPLLLAKAIHDYVKFSYTWNGSYGKYSDNGIKKTIEVKKGNVGDINLLMLGLLKESGLNAEPVLISTRSHGVPNKITPTLSDFNYVIVRVNIDGQFYFLDGTNPLYPFGFVPEDCLNGQGRPLKHTSSWIDIAPSGKKRTAVDLKIKWSGEDTIEGTVIITHAGYAAYLMRQSYFSAANNDEYIQKRIAQWADLQINNYTVTNETDLSEPFIESFNLIMRKSPEDHALAYLQPILIGLIKKNPFLSNERFYPVDFGAPTEYLHLISIEFPKEFEPQDMPSNMALSLPNGGGRYLFNISKLPGKITLTNALSLNKSVYPVEEYSFLKEVYNQYIDKQQTQIVLKTVD